MLKGLLSKIAVMVLWMTFVHARDYSIVFVHLGHQLPSYVKYALKQARLFNEDATIYLIANKGAIVDAADCAVVNDEEISVIWCEDLIPSQAHVHFLKNSPLDATSREGFWKKATERFFCLEELVTTHNLHNVFHLENDTMLYADLHELMPIFKNYKRVAAVFDNDDRCIPGFVYIANPQGLTSLVEYFAANANKGFTDMRIPALYKKEFGPEYIDSLPIITAEYARDHELKSKAGHKVKDKRQYYNNIEHFQSIFDAAALGQYLGGVDPRNNPKNTVGFINESCIFNPSYFSFEWIVDNKNRKVPYINYKGMLCRINNLHIHSKNLQKFMS